MWNIAFITAFGIQIIFTIYKRYALDITTMYYRVKDCLSELKTKGENYHCLCMAYINIYLQMNYNLTNLPVQTSICQTLEGHSVLL